YLADLHTLMAAVENTAYLWLNRELTSQVRHLEKLRTELFANLKPLCEVAGAYVKLRDSLPKETQRRHVASAKVMVPATETPRSWREREEQARIQLSNPWIDVLFRHPRRYALFNALAQGEHQAAVTLEKVFVEAQKGIDDFRQQLRQEPDHIWRYPPIVIGSSIELQMFREGEWLLPRFVLDIARLRSQDKWSALYTVAAIAIAGLALFAGPIGIAAAILDLALSVHSGWHKFQQEDENDSAQAAQVFATGETFSDRPSNYGPIALEGAMALLGAF